MAAGGPAEAIDASLREAEEKVKALYNQLLQETNEDVDKRRANCWDIYDRLKPSHSRPEYRINFRTGKNNLKTLKKQLKNEFLEKTGKVSKSAEQKIDKIVDFINTEPKRTMDGLKSAMEVLDHKKIRAPDYMKLKLIELILDRKIRWDTDDVVEDSISEEDITECCGTLTYGHRKLFEAHKLWQQLLLDESNDVSTTRSLLPMMHWLNERDDDDDDDDDEWVEWNPKLLKDEPTINNPPEWALKYIREEGVQEMGVKMQQFKLGAKPYENKNAVYLLLCRFNQVNENGVNEPTVRAYAGKAQNGVENRWKKHAFASKGIIQRFSELKRFSATPLQSILLVEVLIARLYAEGGRDYLTETGDNITSHDNIALFVYHTYGENAEGTKTMTQNMERLERALIRGLKLKDMKCGMNGRE
ncbi:Hypp1754 [Branchiostoma lanceolatum]|uniref:Hypp1754 protein n=1 Tax=Branchiostoma lanceolatum TaxID=7740 RepID=A0A8K0EK07_BRALA|nr:Hypp1754 [Branchiostoma lanceolatum]